MKTDEGQLSWANEGVLTEEAIAQYRKRIGEKFPTERRGRLRYASADAIRAFAWSIGDGNPLWSDEGHAQNSGWGGIIAPPSIVYSVFLGEVMSGLKGVHAFHSGGSWEFYHPILVGDTITAECTFVDVEEKRSDFAPLWLVATYESVYRNQLAEVVARVRSTQIRAERRGIKREGKYEKITVPHPWAQVERENVEAEALVSNVRGGLTRYFEDVTVGEELPTLVKGPLRQTDIIAWFSTVLVLLSTNEGMREISRHPGLGLLHPASNSREAIESVHWDNEAARSAGLPGAYDLGAQRQSFMMQSLTDWMGDDGFLKKNSCQYRKFVYLGDALWIRGEVTRKYVDENGECCVDIESHTVNQRGEDVMPAFSTVVLPSRETGGYPAGRRSRRGS